MHQKLNNKSEKCILIEYCSESKAYKLYNPLTSKIIMSRDVVFHEESRWNWEEKHQGEHIISIEDSTDDMRRNSRSDNNDNVTLAGTTTLGEGAQRMAQSDDSPPHKIRILTDIYNTCNFALCVTDLTEFDTIGRRYGTRPWM